MNRPPVNFESFFLGLSSDEREAFAREAGTTVEYIRDHLFAGRRMPRAKLISGLAQALESRNVPITRQQLLGFFFQRSEATA